VDSFEQGVVPTLFPLTFASVDYHKPPDSPTVRLRQGVGNGCIHEFGNRPNMIGHAKLHRWRDA
jgi:hypothetical protein